MKASITFELDNSILVHKIKFGKVKSNFSRKLNEDVKTIKSSKKTLTPAEKIPKCINWQKMNTFKKVTKEIESSINEEVTKWAVKRQPWKIPKKTQITPLQR